MLIALVLTLALALTILVLLGLLLVGIHREDRAPGLACRPPTLVTALTRRLVGLHVQKLSASRSARDVPPN